MAKRIKTVGKKAERIKITGKVLPRIEPSEFAAGLDTEPYGAGASRGLDPIALAGLGHELLKRLRSTGGRPALADATEQCKVPLSVADIAALEELTRAIEGATGTRPSLGQVASVILRRHLDELRKVARQDRPAPRAEPTRKNAATIEQILKGMSNDIDTRLNKVLELIRVQNGSNAS